MTLSEFNDLVSRGPVILDGATGSNLRKAGLPVGVCPEEWILKHPDVLLSLQRAYVEAGTQILHAATFSANRIALEGHGLAEELPRINAELVALSRQAAGGKALVAGDLTTTGHRLEPYGDMTDQALFDLYHEQISALANAGVDLLMIETLVSLDEAVIALEAAQSVCELPVMCSLTLEADGQLMFGGSAAEAIETLQAMGAAAVGLNCSVGPDQLESVVSAMKAVAEVPVIAKPNAGMPVMDEFGMAHYSMSPEAFAAAMKKLVWRGARLVGGCCGTDPEYIRRLTLAVKA